MMRVGLISAIVISFVLPALTLSGRQASSSAPSFISGESGITPTTNVPAQSDFNLALQSSRDWLYHTGDFTGKRYSGLQQITAANPSQLRPVCMFQMGEQSNFQTGPIVYNGVMIVTTLHLTIALDAATCHPLWKHEWKALDTELWKTNRGVALKDGRVVRGTSDGYLIALDWAACRRRVVGGNVHHGAHDPR
jgi:glucose dehydrogenase